MSSRDHHDDPQPPGSAKSDKYERPVVCDDDSNGDIDMSGAASELSVVRCDVNVVMSQDPADISFHPHHHYGDYDLVSRSEKDPPVSQSLCGVRLICYYADQSCCKLKCRLPSCFRS